MKLTGSPVIYDLDVYKQSDVQQHRLGALGVGDNGDVYRYTKINSSATDLTAGHLIVSLGREANHINVALSAAAAVGATLVIPTVGATAVDANEYDEGTLVFNDVAPEGYSYTIISHEANAGSLATDVRLERGLLVAATATSEVSLIRNVWNNPAVSQLIAERPAGVAMSAWDVSVANFGWLKTRGVAAVLVDTAGVTVGYKATISDQVNGAVGVLSDLDAEFEVGQMMATGTATEFNPIYLTID